MTYQKSTKNGLQKVIENDIEKLGKHLFFLLDEITQKSPNNNKSYLLNKKYEKKYGKYRYRKIHIQKTSYRNIVILASIVNENYQIKYVQI